MNKYQSLKLAIVVLGFTIVGPLGSASMQQPPNSLERVPTFRGRTDTFPRWLTPIQISRLLTEYENPVPGQNPRYFSSEFSPTSMDIDLHGVVHIVGTYNNQGTIQVIHVSSTPQSRGSSGFSSRTVLAEYSGDITTPGQYYMGAADPNFCPQVAVGPGDSVYVVWYANYFQLYSNPNGVSPTERLAV